MFFFVVFSYISWCAYNTYCQRSKRLKQLVSRMNFMIENNIRQYPGDQGTLADYHRGIECKTQSSRDVNLFKY